MFLARLAVSRRYPGRSVWSCVCFHFARGVSEVLSLLRLCLHGACPPPPRTPALGCPGSGPSPWPPAPRPPARPPGPAAAQPGMPLCPGLSRPRTGLRTGLSVGRWGFWKRGPDSRPRREALGGRTAARERLPRGPPRAVPPVHTRVTACLSQPSETFCHVLDELPPVRSFLPCLWNFCYSGSVPALILVCFSVSLTVPVIWSVPSFSVFSEFPDRF